MAEGVKVNAIRVGLSPIGEFTYDFETAPVERAAVAAVA
jgi:hypothetical protein